MQWLIDLILNTIRTTGLVVNRGDPAPADFTIGDFTIDGAWHDLNLSAIIPENVNITYVSLIVRATTIGKYVLFRTKGHVNTQNKSRATIQVANVRLDQDIQLFPDNNRIVEYRAITGIDSILDLTIKGWDF